MATKDNLVKLYYLGGLCPPGESRPVSGFGTPVMLPQAGEYIEVEKHIASDILRKYVMATPDGRYVSPFTKNGKYAKRVMSGDASNVIQIGAASAEQLSDEELLQELERRSNLTKAQIQSPGETEDDGVFVEEAAPKRRGNK